MPEIIRIRPPPIAVRHNAAQCAPDAASVGAHEHETKQRQQQQTRNKSQNIEPNKETRCIGAQPKRWATSPRSRLCSTSPRHSKDRKQHVQANTQSKSNEQSERKHKQAYNTGWANFIDGAIQPASSFAGNQFLRPKAPLLHPPIVLGIHPKFAHIDALPPPARQRAATRSRSPRAPPTTKSAQERAEAAPSRLPTPAEPTVFNDFVCTSKSSAFLATPLHLPVTIHHSHIAPPPTPISDRRFLLSDLSDLSGLSDLSDLQYLRAIRARRHVPVCMLLCVLRSVLLLFFHLSWERG